VAELHEKFGLDPFVFPENLTFRDFDKLYKAPKAGFKSVEEYYEICSAKRYVSDISIPCRIIFSEDDPIIPPDCLEGVSIPSNVEIYSSKLGGHMGFLGDVRHPRGLRWLDSLLVDWIKELSA
jgi:predicted alpha/beta-fold hydrolase